MIAERFPEVGVRGEGEVLGRSAVGEAIARRECLKERRGRCLSGRDKLGPYMPVFIVGLLKVNLAVDNAFTSIKVGLDGAIGVEDATAAAKLDATLAAIAVRGDKVDTILERSRHPTTAGRLIIQPVRGKQDDVRSMQSGYPRRLKVFRVHTDERSQAAQWSLPYRHTDITVTRPTRLRDVRMNFAVGANNTFGAKQGNTVVIDVCVGVNFWEAHGDIATIVRGELLEAVCSRAGNWLDMRRDFLTRFPAVASCCHLRENDQTRFMLCCLFNKPEQIADVLLSGTRRGFILNSGNLISGEP